MKEHSPTRSYPADLALQLLAARDAGDFDEAERCGARISAYNGSQPGFVRPLHEAHLRHDLVNADSICGLFSA